MAISLAPSGNAATPPDTDIAGAAANANQINWAIDPENLLHETQPTAPAAKGVNSPSRGRRMAACRQCRAPSRKIVYRQGIAAPGPSPAPEKQKFRRKFQ